MARWVLCQAMSKILTLLLQGDRIWDHFRSDGHSHAFPSCPPVRAATLACKSQIKLFTQAQEAYIPLALAVTRVKLFCLDTVFLGTSLCTVSSHKSKDSPMSLTR